MRFLSIVAAIPLLAPVACRTTADDPPLLADGGHGTSPGDNDADTRLTGTSPGDNDADTRLTGTGILFLEATGGVSGEVSADVAVDAPGDGQARSCTSPVDAGAGACQLTSCLLGGVGTPVPGDGNFGPISVSVGTTTLPLTYDVAGYPTLAFPSSVTLGTGGTMTFRGGDGTVVPTFDVTATIPGLAVLTAPVPTTDGGLATIDTSQDLAVTWAAIPAGQFTFELDGGSFTPGETAITIACTFDATAGSGSVPRALLSAMKGLSGASAVYARIGAEIMTTTTVDKLTIITRSTQRSPSAVSRFNVTFE